MKKISCVLALALAVMFAASAAMAFPAVDVYQKTAPSVVLILASSGGSDGSLIGAGSIISEDGLVITNAHVVINDNSGRPFSKISVFTKPEEVTGDFQADLKYRHKARVLAYDRELDLALVKVQDLRPGTGTISLANPRQIMVGEEVVAIGHPEQGGLWALTYGRISGQIAHQSKVKGKNVWQTDTSVNRGNSGGPLLDRRGYLVGVNTNIARRGSGDLAITGVNFSLKSSVVVAWMQKQGMTLAYGTAPLNGEAASESVASSSKPRAAQSEPERPATDSEPVRQPVQQVAPVTKAKPAEKAPIIEEKPLKSDTILTPKKPYKKEDLYRAVEADLEDMMMEMKTKTRNKKRW